MKKTLLALAFFTGFTYSASAANIQNLKVIPNDTYLSISWDPLSQSDLANSDGYAIQWSELETSMRIDKFANIFTNQNSYLVRRASFENNKDYYFRIYSYKKENRDTVLGTGSKILKWKISYTDETTFSEIEPNDPVIATAAAVVADELNVDFGNLRTTRLDNFADISWSKPRKLSSSDYDGFHIKVSSKIDMSDTVVEFDTPKNIIKARVKGLTPDTQYYARGYFYKTTGSTNTPFGSGAVKSFKTIKAIDRTKNSRASRNIKRFEKRNYFTAQVPGTENTTSTSTNSTTTSTTSTTQTTSTKVDNNTTDIKAIRVKISELKKELKKIQKEYRAWQKKLRDANRASRSKK